ncbi:hypothetical protein [Bacillus phage vB_BanS-Thrax5]|nr:hypothetical protein [Bacillus phage vB_BanS-Thrax5]
MNVAEIIRKANMLEEGMERASKAIALGMSAGSPQHVIDSLLEDYKRYSSEYYKFMQTNVEIDDGFKEVIQITWDGSFFLKRYRHPINNTYQIMYTNDIKYAKVFTDEKELKKAIKYVEKEGHSVRLIKKR